MTAGDPKFTSILYGVDDDPGPAEASVAPDCFGDLNLDQVVAAAITGRDAYQLAPYFYAPVTGWAAIRYRQAVLHDFETPRRTTAFEVFAASMREQRACAARAQKAGIPEERHSWVLEAARTYVRAVRALSAELAGRPPASEGLRGLEGFLRDYIAGAAFRALAAATDGLEIEITALRYELLIRGLVVQVRKPTGAVDFGATLAATFERFRSQREERYAFRLEGGGGPNLVEGRIVEELAALEAPLFARLAAFAERYGAPVHPVLERAEREAQFCLAYLGHIAPLRALGLPFTYPQATAAGTVDARQVFDLALAHKLAARERQPVLNDIRLDPPERMLVVSGPNQGGKTTFARTFGQLHYLASLGLPTPGSRVTLTPPDRVLTHFETGEHMATLRGKLQDDLMRLHEILAAATAGSVVVVNEAFASTTLEDARLLSRQIGTRLLDIGAACVWVTFIEDLATLDERTVSLISQVKAADPSVRTFKVVRGPPGGLAYALSIAERYRLTKSALMERLA
ncbi:MAG TPA: hypothetical protein VFW13_08870 [Phenylobacterium sp.]|nr:hypothetical protein [Phenylobacterium sp.]